MNEKEMPDGITQQMIDDAKRKYGVDKVKFVDIFKENSDEVELTVLVTVPSRTIVGQFLKFEDADPKKAQDIIVKNCLLSHRERVLADDGLFFGALSGISELIPVRKAAVKNV